MSKLDFKMKVEKEMPEFASEVAGLSVENLNGRLAELAKAYEEIEAAKESDEGLEEARERAKAQAAPYLEGKKSIRLKSRYIVSLINEKGGA